MGRQLLALFTSRWIEAFVLLLWIVGLRTRQHWLVWIALVLATAVVAALIGVFIAGRRPMRTRLEDMPQGRNKSRKCEPEPKKNDKNKIERTQ